MANLLKKLLLSLWESAMSDSINKALKLVERKSGDRLLDCGCGNGELTIKVANIVGNSDVYGIDLDGKVLQKAMMKSVKAYRCDLNKHFPFESNFFDIVFAHQVIEHLHDIDNFVKEVRRVLKSGGYAIVSTENLSSWHNIFALILGYQDFSHHSSNELYIGNPLSPHYMERLSDPLGLHIKILSYQSLKEIFEIYGFNVEKIIGAGYYPFSSGLSSLLSSLDPRHAHFITLKARKTASDDKTSTTSKHRTKKAYKRVNERYGRLKVIEFFIDRNKFSLDVGSKEVHFGNNTVNIDIDPRCRPNVVADARYLPFGSGIFEQIFFTDVIEHLPKGSEPRALREIHRVLREKGELILTSPHNRLLFVLLDPAFYLMGHRHYGLTEIKKMLEASGFNLVKIFTSGFFWACMNVIWYTFITYPVKKIFNYSLPYAPLTLQSFEDKEHEKIGENGYTVFIKALKQNAT